MSSRHDTDRTIEILGSVGGSSRYTSDCISAILEQDRQELAHGSQYTGRPTTRLHVGLNDVVKLRLEEYNHKSGTVVELARQTLERERTYQVHHPDKTWFVIHRRPGVTPIIGNACPRLAPLHTVLTNENSTGFNTRTHVDYLLKICTLYFQTARDHHMRLDEGLSNFGLSPDGTLYYLDDDLYPWDEFLGFAQILGVYFRSLEWLTPLVAAQFGADLRRLIIQHFNSGHYIYVLSELLSDVFVPATNREKALEAFRRGLDRRRGARKSVSLESKKIAVLADIHANLPALEVTMAFLKQQRIEQGLVLGDIVGYGPHPRECIAHIQSAGFTVLKGNHDHAAARGVVADGLFSPHAKWAMEWTIQQLKPSDRKWLEELPPVLQGEGWMAVHGAPIDPSFLNGYVYHMTYEANLDLLERRALPLCFHGHSHIPGVYARKKGAADQYYAERTQTMKESRHSLVCPGSIGQPRGGAIGAHFAIYDQEDKSLTLHRLDYDVERTAKDMTDRGFPGTLISRLRQGH